MNPSINTSNNRLSTSDNYTFDNSGNTTADASGQTYTYDGENKMVEAANSNGTLGEYFYDGDGKRVKKYVPDTGEVTVFVYDATGKSIAEYSTIVASSTDAKVNYLTSDHLGSPRINTDANGNIITRHDYHPFGEEIYGTGGRTTGLNYGDDSVRKQFTGYERDGETGLDFAQARFYMTTLGRFMIPDEPFVDQYESAPQQWNLYTYVTNNPLLFVDTDGLWKQEKCSSGLCWVAEDGDTLYGLARKLQISGTQLAKYFGDVDPNHIETGHVFDLSGFKTWAIQDDWKRLEDKYQKFNPDIPNDGNRSSSRFAGCDNIAACHPTARDPNIDKVFTKGVGSAGKQIPTGLRQATAGLKQLFNSGTNGSVRNMPIINIRTLLRENGFIQKLANNRKGYLFTNAEGETVRVMRRGGGWDIRINNRFGSELDEFGNVGSRVDAHGISVRSQ